MSTPGPTATPAWVVGDFMPGDEAAILALFGMGFGKARPVTFWRWRFAESPYGGPFASVARLKSDGTVVGVYLFIPFELSYRGQTYPAAQGVDLVVHTDYRKQGMFEQMARHSYEALAGQGFRAQLAFPNPGAMSYPGFTRTLGWPALCALRRSTRRLDLERPLATLLRSPALARMGNAVIRPLRLAALEREARVAREQTKHLRWTTLQSVPDAVDPLWEACRQGPNVAFVKDTRYLRWRYERHPDERFVYTALMRGDTLAGLAITHERSGALMICECLAAPDEPHAEQRLIAETSLLAMQRGLRSISRFGPENAPSAPAWRGFTPVAATDNVLVGIALGEGPLRDAFAAAPEWTVTYGDPDFV